MRRRRARTVESLLLQKELELQEDTLLLVVEVADVAVREAVLGPSRLHPFGGAGRGGRGVFGHDELGRRRLQSRVESGAARRTRP